MYTLEELAKSMRVMRLKDEEYSCYLTASDDQESITLSHPYMSGWKPKKTEWRVEWVNRSKHSNYAGQVRLWSIYNKVLSFDGDPADYYSHSVLEALSQKAAGGPEEAQSSAEWRFELKTKLDKPVVDIYRWSDKEAEMMTLSVLSIPNSDSGNDNTPTLVLSFLPHSRVASLLWINGPSWIAEVVNIVKAAVQQQRVEVVKKAKDSEQQRVTTKPKNSKENQVASNNHVTTLANWQVGQVYFSGSHAPNVGPSSSNFINSGGNHNGSGVQKNGDATVANESGTSSAKKPTGKATNKPTYQLQFVSLRQLYDMYYRR